jgi:hypothetical protein
MRSHRMSARRQPSGTTRPEAWQLPIVLPGARLRGRFSARGTKNRKRPVEAAGAVDAKNAPTAPWKTGRPVSHSYHRLFLLFTDNRKSVTHVPG